MKNAMQLKAIVKNIAKEKKISAQLVLQNYMLERFLERDADGVSGGGTEANGRILKNTTVRGEKLLKSIMLKESNCSIRMIMILMSNFSFA